MQTSWELREDAQASPPGEFPPGLETLGLSPLLLGLLRSRGLTSPEAIRRYLDPCLDHLLDPFQVPGVRQAAELVRRHLAAGSKILIHGDYDVDGVTASAVLARTFHKLGAEADVFLPHRIRDGYGLTQSGIRAAREKGAKLIITVDCGICALREIADARAAGIDVIITDHHQFSSDGVPDANAIIHPLMDAAMGEPFKELSAVGLAYKLSQALLGAESHEFLDLVALGTVADMAPLAGENRIFVKHGLERLVEGKNQGLKCIAEAAKVKGRFSTRHLGFVFGPRINASGRMDSADISFQLLVTRSEREGGSLARILEEENGRRQRYEREATKEAIRKAEREMNFARDRVIVVWDRGWHPGVVGIVASRLVDRFYRPAIVISVDEEGKGRGSARSIRHFNIHEALNQVSVWLLEHGGHEQAAGLKIEEGKLEDFRRALNEYAASAMDPAILVKAYDIDCEIRLSDLSVQLLRELSLLEPHGLGNPKPVFLTRGLSVKGKPAVSGKDSVRFWVEDGMMTLEAVWSRARPFDWESEGRVDLVYTPGVKTWNGETFPVLEVKDVKLSV